MSKTIDNLIKEVNRVVLLPDSEELRDSCIDHVIAVYTKIGVDSFPDEESLFPVKAGIVTMPQTCMKIQDILVRPNGREANDIKNYSIGLIASRITDRFTTNLSFRIDDKKIKFVNKSLDWVKVIFKSLPKNERGEILIDDYAYTACVEYCNCKEMLVKSSNTKQERSTLNPTMFWCRLADKSIDEARAFYNSSNEADDRYVEVVHHLQTRTY